MSKLNIDQKTILNLLSDPKADFLIPDYQRPYAWGKAECQTLWEDIVSFAIPEEDETKFNSNDEYFLGPIVTFKNNGKYEVIDGQQRLTTLMLLLRAFYEKFSSMRDPKSIATSRNIEKCIWKTDEYDERDPNTLKIDSEVATDNDKEEFLNILKSGVVNSNQKSMYAQNFRFFQEEITKFLNTYPTFVAPLATRILKNCILLPIEAESQDTALRIFSTLNDRGKPLADADIFKAQFYKYYTQKNEKSEFIKRWKLLEEVCTDTFKSAITSPMDEIFTRYMYYLRAKENITSTTTEGLRRFYERNSYSVLKDEKTLKGLEELADFWSSVSKQDSDRFNEEVLRKLFVLNYAPNGMWYNLVSVYFITHKDAENQLDDAQFSVYLSKITAFIWAYALTNPGVNALRTPLFAEMAGLCRGIEATFNNVKFEENYFRSVFDNYGFHNQRALTRSMLAWWAMHPQHNQETLSLETIFDIEHIYARNRQNNEHGLQDDKSLGSLGNKALLERKINIRASDYRFVDKKKYYLGTDKKAPTKIAELKVLAQKPDFTELDIKERYQLMKNAFVDFLRDNQLLKD